MIDHRLSIRDGADFLVRSVASAFDAPSCTFGSNAWSRGLSQTQPMASPLDARILRNFKSA
jgi:uncharacterized protein YfaQ (DUF2300 family)